MRWKQVEMRSFLKERKGKFKPGEEKIKGLKRIEKIDFSGNLHLSDKPSKTDMILIKEGDLVISGINVEKGAMSIYSGKEDVIATIHYSSYEYNATKIDVEFLRYFLKSPEFIDALKEQVPGGIKTEIKPKHILPLKVYIPEEIEGQKSIVQFLDGQNRLIDSQDSELTHQLSLVKQLRQAFLREAMQGKLVAQDPQDEPAAQLLAKIKAEKERLIGEKKIREGKLQEAEMLDELLFEIPGNWEWCKLDEICLNITDGTHQTPNYTNTGRIFLSAQNVKPFRFMPEGHKFVSEEAYQSYIKNRKPERGDLLIGRVGAGIGETAVIDQDLDFCIYVSLGLVQPFKQFVDSNYLAYVFNSPYGYKYAKGNTSSKGGSAGNFNLGRIRSFLIPLPPLAEQHRIVAKLDELMRYCDALEASIQASREQNEGLLQQVLREALEPGAGE